MDPRKPHEEYSPPVFEEEDEEDISFAGDHNEDFRRDLNEEFNL